MRLKDLLNEINILRHDQNDDNNLTDAMQRSYRIRIEQNRPLYDFGNIDGIEVLSDQLPLQYRPYFFFQDSLSNLVGFAIIETYKLKQIENVFYVKLIYLLDKVRKSGLGMGFYKLLLDKGVTILSDVDQTTASRALWARLALTPGYQVWSVRGDQPVEQLTDTSSVYEPKSGLRMLVRKG